MTDSDGYRLRVEKRIMRHTDSGNTAKPEPGENGHVAPKRKKGDRSATTVVVGRPELNRPVKPMNDVERAEYGGMGGGKAPVAKKVAPKAAPGSGSKGRPSFFDSVKPARPGGARPPAAPPARPARRPMGPPIQAVPGAGMGMGGGKGGGKGSKGKC